MAKIEELQPRIVYPWIRWLDGTTHEAQQGTDFTIELKAFCNSLYRKACLLKRNVATKADHAAKSVRFRFYDKVDSKVTLDPPARKATKRAVQKGKTKAANKTRKRPTKQPATS